MAEVTNNTIFTPQGLNAEHSKAIGRRFGGKSDASGIDAGEQQEYLDQRMADLHQRNAPYHAQAEQAAIDMQLDKARRQWALHHGGLKVDTHLGTVVLGAHARVGR
jgi:hypothetical protein